MVETAIISILLTFSSILMILEVAQQRVDYVSFLQSSFEVLMKIVSIRAILFKYFENRKLPLETGPPWGAILKCRMIASNQHSNVFWTFIFIRSFFYDSLAAHSLPAAQSGWKNRENNATSKEATIFWRVFCGRHNRKVETFWDSGDLPSLTA